MAVLSLEPIPGKNWKPDELEALRARAVEAIEDYLDTSRIEMDGSDGPRGFESFNDHLFDRRGTGDASLGIGSDTPSLIVSDRFSNVQRVDGFLKSLGFVGGILPTPGPTLTPRRRPIS